MVPGSPQRGKSGAARGDQRDVLLQPGRPRGRADLTFFVASTVGVITSLL